MEKLITRKEAAKLLGISLTTLDEARNSGLIGDADKILDQMKVQESLHVHI